MPDKAGTCACRGSMSVEPVGTIRWSHASLLGPLVQMSRPGLFAFMRRLEDRLATANDVAWTCGPVTIGSLLPWMPMRQPSMHLSSQNVIGLLQAPAHVFHSSPCQERVRPLFFSLAALENSWLDPQCCEEWPLDVAAKIPR